MHNITTLNAELKNTISANGKVGLVLLATDQITLYEFENIFKGTQVLNFPARVMNSTEITPEELIKIKDELSSATRTILPEINLDVVAFSCTSASMTIGEAEVEHIIKHSSNDRVIHEVTNPFSAIKSACSFLDVKRLGLITPYIEEVSQGIIDGMEEEGIMVSHASSFKISSDNKVPDITPASIVEAAKEMAKNESIQTIFISCTNLNICQEIQTLEEQTGKTILTSNQVMAWDILRLCKYKEPVKGFGKLLEKKR